MKLCIYHANCLDGFAAAFCHWQGNYCLTGTMDWGYYAMNYGDVKTVDDLSALFPWLFNGEKHEVVVLDFSLPKEVTGFLLSNTLIHFTMLDHHKTAFEMMAELFPNVNYPETFDVLWPTATVTLDNDKSGAMLAYGYYQPNLKPLEQLVTCIDDRDRWQFKYEYTKAVCAAVVTWPQEFSYWDEQLDRGTELIPMLVEEGNAILRYKDQLVRQIAETYTTSKIDGMDFRIVNCPPQLASDVGNELADDMFAALCYSFIGDKTVKVSLRSKGDMDVSAVAKLYGGGGHKNAAGFELEDLNGIAALYCTEGDDDAAR